MTLEPISVQPFYLIEESGHIYQFHPLHLAQYFLHEGNFTNPYTRNPLNIVELRRLDRLVKKYDSTFVSLCDEQKRLTIQRAQEREHIRVCQLLHHECLQLVRRILYFVQHPQSAGLDEILFRMEHTLLPQFFDTFRQLFVLDQPFACDSIGHIIQNLQTLYHNATVVHTQEGCFIVESVLATLSQFASNVVPMLPAVLPELAALPILAR
jgi:hypothetical protein